MCSCNKVIRAPYGAAIYRGLSAMLPSYLGWRLVWEWRLDSWVEDHSMSLRSSSMLLTLPSM